MTRRANPLLVRLVSHVPLGAGLRSPGELWDIPDDEAARLIEEGQAVPVLKDAAKETR